MHLSPGSLDKCAHVFRNENYKSKIFNASTRYLHIFLSILRCSYLRFRQIVKGHYVFKLFKNVLFHVKYDPDTHRDVRSILEMFRL